ncbi:MAG TPA: hypothetical protein VMK83_05595 [Gaiellaceae bacterium]|nr:hypothetical protein [Gaiellaceae bacterium]
METAYAFTRTEIAEYLREPFDRPGLVTRDELLASLEAKGAPREMIDLLTRRIPENAQLADLRALWVHLRDVPLEQTES